MISVQDLTVDFGKQLLFDSINFVISKGERVALVGHNGAGKSTLMKILVGIEQPTSGAVSRPRDLSIGYLPQVKELVDHTTLRAEVEEVFKDVQSLNDQYDRLSEELATRTDYDSPEYLELIERHGHLTDLIQMHHPSQYLAEMERTLLGLGFERSDFDRPTREFSGGWRMRIELAKVLLSNPDLLLLDEPTNHLDIESIDWLEHFLIARGVTLLLVSHDRTFLDNVTNRTIEIELGRIYDYKTSYSHYVTLREERLEQQKRAYENQQKKIQDIESFVERFRYKPTKSAQVQSRIKQLDKIEEIELDEIDTRHINFTFPMAGRSGDYPVIIEELDKSYGSLSVLRDVSMTIKRGEKVAFVGKNGSGKSTLMRCIMGQEEYTGKLQIGHGVEVAYFSQNRAQELPADQTIRDAIDSLARGDMRLHINDMLGAFLFGGEVADKPISVLSGGERARVAIMQMLLEPANLLILDEPTNHLDIRTKEILKRAIAAFPGTVIVVSHDRYFLSGLVDRIFSFSHGAVRECMDGLDGYLATLHEELNQQPSTNSQQPTANSQSPTANSQQPKANRQPQLDYQQQKEQQKRLRTLRRTAESLGEQLEQLQEQQAKLEEEIATAATPQLIDQYTQVNKKIQELTPQWEEAEFALMEYEEEIQQ